MRAWLFVILGVGLVVLMQGEISSQTLPGAATRAGNVAVYDTPLAVCQAYCRLTLEPGETGTSGTYVVTKMQLVKGAEAIEQLSIVQAQLESAIASRFKNGNAIVFPDSKTMTEMMTSILDRLPKAKIIVSDDGREATVTYPPEEHPKAGDPPTEPFICVRVGGGWKIDYIKTMHFDESYPQAIRHDESLMRSYEALRKDVEAGKFPSAAEIASRVKAAEAEAQKAFAPGNR